MKKFEGILICSDLDGTLLSSDKTVSEENLRAIEYFKSQGGSFTVISGRVPITAEAICNIIKPNAPIGCFNGGAIYDYSKREYVWKETLPSTVMELIRHIDENVSDVGIQIYTPENIYIAKDDDAMYILKRFPVEFRGYDQIDEPFAKVVFATFDEEKITKVANELGNHPLAGGFDFIRSEKTLYEILPKNVSKGNALLKLAAIYGFEKTIAIGDYDNDVSMIQNAETGYAVANACDAAKAVADVITVSNNENAIAKLIDDLDCGKIFF